MSFIKHHLRFHLDVLNTVKTTPFHLCLKFWEQKEVTASQIQRIRKVGDNNNNAVIGYKLLSVNCIVSRGLSQWNSQFFFATDQNVSTSHIFMCLLQNITAEIWIYSLGCRDIFLAHNSFDLTENDHHALDCFSTVWSFFFFLDLCDPRLFTGTNVASYFIALITSYDTA